MGVRGPVGVPARLHQLRGMTPGAARSEPTAPVSLSPVAPSPPAWLAGEALAEWKRIVPELDRQGLLAEVDRAVLTGFCVAWSVLVRAAAELADAPSLVTDGNRSEVLAPRFRAWRDASATLAALASKCLATPVDRMRSRLTEPAVPDSAGILD